MITVCFTTGFISIKRGRITRKYNPCWNSFNRLCNVLNHGPASSKYTQRSTVYTWKGLSTLSESQRAVYKMMMEYQDTWTTHMDDYHMGYYFALLDVCEKMGIHHLVLFPNEPEYGE